MPKKQIARKKADERSNVPAQKREHLRQKPAVRKKSLASSKKRPSKKGLMKKIYDGKLSLPELQSTLIVDEQLGFVRLVTLDKNPDDSKTNIATFVKDPSNEPPPKLLLVVVAEGQPPVDLNGIKEFYRSRIFVSETLTLVACCR